MREAKRIDDLDRDMAAIEARPGQSVLTLAKRLRRKAR
jgi:hypothetical protein